MNILRLSTITMLVFGVLAIIAGATTDVGPFGILLGMLMIVSGIVKVVALRIMSDQRAVKRDER